MHQCLSHLFTHTCTHSICPRMTHCCQLIPLKIQSLFFSPPTFNTQGNLTFITNHLIFKEFHFAFFSCLVFPLFDWRYLLATNEASTFLCPTEALLRFTVDIFVTALIVFLSAVFFSRPHTFSYFVHL